MLLEMAVADAYAIAWEFTDKQKAKNDLSGYFQHPTYLELSAGQYTDDTQRSIANAEVILSTDTTDKFDMLAYAQAYMKAYNRDPREGYSRGYNAFLKSVATPESFLNEIKKTKGSNGSLMGVAPLGFIREVEHCKQAATIQAITTHHPSTAIHAQIVALSAHYYLHYQAPGGAELEDFLLENVDWLSGGDEQLRFLGQVEDYRRKVWKSTGIKAETISSYVVFAQTEFSSLSKIILDAVARGGDTDSAAASAVAVACLNPNIENDIPQVLIDNLEPGNTTYGVEFLRALDGRLGEKFL